MSKRQAGVLLHPTSLPNVEGQAGVLNAEAWRFVDWMEEAGLSIWQTLPLTEPHADLSPYRSVSAFALNPALLPDDWQDQLNPTMFNLYMAKPPFWLWDYAVFMAIKDEHQGQCWVDWPEAFKFKDEATIERFVAEHEEQILSRCKEQFMLSYIWRDLKKYANQKRIELFGDMPIFVAFDSVDVWANPDQFILDENLQPTVVTGVPPDYFSETGQRWGNPHYDWDAMQADGFSWWKSRIEESFQHFDLVRIDHFRGLEAVWEIDAEEETAINGDWVKVPGEKLLDALQEEFPNLPLVAEDLGVITDEVIALKNKYDLPGMAVLQFGFNGLPDNPHALQEQVENSIAYTGTHDNDTSLGWFDSLDEQTQNWVLSQIHEEVGDLLQALALPENYQKMPWLLVVAAMHTVANRVVVPLQDLLGLGSEDRMNIPGTPEGNWRWQFSWQQFPQDLTPQLNNLIEKTQRGVAKALQE